MAFILAVTFMSNDNNTKETIIIRKSSGDTHDDHHGGAWKVAYADFVTAMMAFFIMLWILAVVEEEKLKGVAEYFQPTLTPQDFITGEGVLSGTTIGQDGVFNSSNAPMLTIATPDVGKDDPGEQEAVADPSQQEVVDPTGHTTTAVGVVEVEAPEVDEVLQEARDQEKEALEELSGNIVQAMQEIPDLEPLVPNLVFEMTPDGMEIQIVDQEQQPMFPLGTAEMLPQTRDLMSLIAVAVSKMPNELRVVGHTDSTPFVNDQQSRYGNWELSSDRANATRRVLLDAGLDEKRIMEVTGVADRDPLLPQDPENAVNRRMAIILDYASEDPQGSSEQSDSDDGDSVVPALPSLDRDTFTTVPQSP